MKIAIIGGQTKADFLIDMFKRENHRLVVVNDTAEYGAYLSKKYNIDVLVNDPAKRYVLEEAEIYDFDVLVSLLPNDADNLAVCQIAKKILRIKKTVVSVSNPRNVEYFKSLGVDTVLSATYMISKYIEKASVLEGIARSIITEFESIAITTITVKNESQVVDKSLIKLALPSGISVAAIMRENEVIIPKGETVLKGGDRLLVISDADKQQRVIDQFAAEK